MATLLEPFFADPNQIPAVTADLERSPASVAGGDGWAVRSNIAAYDLFTLGRTVTNVLAGYA